MYTFQLLLHPSLLIEVFLWWCNRTSIVHLCMFWKVQRYYADQIGTFSGCPLRKWFLVSNVKSGCQVYQFSGKGQLIKADQNRQQTPKWISWAHLGSVCKVKWTGFSTKHTWLCWLLGHLQWGILSRNIQRWLFAEMLLASQGCSALWLQSPRFAPGLIRSFVLFFAFCSMRVTCILLFIIDMTTFTTRHPTCNLSVLCKT